MSKPLRWHTQVYTKAKVDKKVPPIAWPLSVVCGVVLLEEAQGMSFARFTIASERKTSLCNNKRKKDKPNLPLIFCAPVPYIIFCFFFCRRLECVKLQ